MDTLAAPPVSHRGLLSRLTPRQRSRLLAGAVTMRFPKGATLFRQGQPADYIWLVLEGWAHLVRSNDPEAGNGSVVLFTVTPEEVLCGLSAIGTRRYETGAVAATACRALRLPADRFNAALAASPAFADGVLRLCLRRIRHITRQYGSMAEPVSCRLVRALLRLREQFGDAIPVTHRELAQMAWTSTETAIRAVRQLKQQGCLDGARGRIHVRDTGALLQALARPAPRSA